MSNPNLIPFLTPLKISQDEWDRIFKKGKYEEKKEERSYSSHTKDELEDEVTEE